MKTRKEFGPHLIRLSSIGLLAEVVEDFLKPTNVEARTDLTIVLDAPLALDYLGCSGLAMKDDIRTVLLALQKIGASVIVFPVSCIEMQHNLRSMLSLPGNLRRGYTHNAMIKREVDADYVQAVANNPENALANAGVTVRQISLDAFPYMHRHFTKDHYEDFYETVTWGNTVAAREHDATCMTFVMRLREARPNSDLFKSRFVMVTRNPTFVRHSREYCLKSRMITFMQEGPVIHARELATTAWLRTGLDADETIPRGHLIATCERVLQMKPEVRNALASQLERITPVRLEQFNLLLQDARSVQKLADQTLNNEDIVSAENAEHLLETMRLATAEELKEKHDAELTAIRKTADQEAEQNMAALARVRAELAASQAKEAAATALKHSQLQAIADSINGRAEWVEKYAGYGLLALGALGLLNYFTGYLSSYWTWGLIVLGFGIVGFARTYFALLEKPMPALATALSKYCDCELERQLKPLGLLDQKGQCEIKAGRVTVKT